MRRLLPLLAVAALVLTGVWVGSRLLATEGSTMQGADATVPGAARPELAEGQPGALVDAGPSEAPGRSEAAAALPPVDKVGGATTGSLLVLTRSAGGAAVPNVSFVLDQRDELRLGAGVELHATDVDGRARVEGVAPGKVRLWSSRGARTLGEVVAGEESELVLEFKDCVDVSGLVVDAGGIPVAGADVWISSWRHDWLTTQHVTRTDSEGSFKIASVDRDKSIGATAPGHGPSELVDLALSDLSVSPVQLELPLGLNGGALRGRVLSHEGRPVVGARVAVGATLDEYSMRSDGSQREVWGVRVATSGTDGAYELTGLSAGQQPVAVRAAGHPELDAEVEIVAGESTALDFTLLQGLRVVGVVHDGDGEPVEHAIVLALDGPFLDQFPTQGPTDQGVPFHRPATRSAADGTFELLDLVPGDVHLYAAKGVSYWDSRADVFIGTAQATLSGKAGETLNWQPRLERGREIRGRVTYADGRPLGSIFVSAVDPEGEQSRSTTHADKDGHFVIPGLENMSYTVKVQLWDAPDDAPPLDKHDVWPSESEIVLVASYSRSNEARANVSIRVADDAGRIRGKAAVKFAHERGARHATDKDGVFSAKVPPGRYQPRVMSGDDLVGHGEWFEVGPGEHRDLGTVHTLPGGGLVVRLERVPDVDPEGLFVTVKTAELSLGWRELAGDSSEVKFDGLLAGPAVLLVQGPGMANVRREVLIEAGSTREVDVRLQRAAQCTLIFEGNPASGWGRLELTVHDASGTLLREWTHRERWSGALPLQHSLAVPCGRFTIEAKLPDGRSATGEVAVESLDEPVTATFVFD